MKTFIRGLLITSVLGCYPASGADNEGPLSEFTPTLSDEFKLSLRAADVTAGEVVFMRKCSSCHDHEKTGGHGKGPHLWNIMGRKAGSAPDFEYSEAMRGSGHTWDYATLNYYLIRTDRAVPGRLMEFRGIRRDAERAKLLAYLRTLHDTPPPRP